MIIMLESKDIIVNVLKYFIKFEMQVVLIFVLKLKKITGTNIYNLSQ